YIPERVKNLANCLHEIEMDCPGAQINTHKIAIVAVIGTNMKIPGFLSRAANALAKAGINILALDQCMRQVNMQFMVEREHFKEAQIVLHREFVEKDI
ncbi:MAG: ACT domain-containing protein, partial [Lentisphaeria bacterium]|nr:ACT domain-containing protein [Lentisphaeria bacterium]